MTAAMGSLARKFEAFERARGKDPAHDLRRRAFARFRELGLPTSRDEEWRFTPVAPIEKSDYPLARPGDARVTAADVERLALGGPAAARLVFVDGHYRNDLSSAGAGLDVGSLASSMPKVLDLLAGEADEEGEDRPFLALNAAFLEDGPYVRISRGSGAPDPIHILHVATGRTSFPRGLILAEEGSHAQVVESFVSLGAEGHLTIGATDVFVGRNASLEHARLQMENGLAVHVAALRIRQERDSRYTSHQVTLGGALVRNDLDASLDGEHVLCTLNGLFVTRGTQHVDNHTRLLHRKPHGESHELYKGILDGKSSAVFSGKIHVYEDAQKTDAKQSSANLLLSDEAVIDAKPQLEIYADDVKCTHGATIGQLDPSALFYLRARAIPVERARLMLVSAFAADVTSRIGIPAARERVDGILADRLPGVA